MKDYRKISKEHSYLANEKEVTENILQTSALLRIADATELMAQSYAQIIKAKEQAESDRDRNWRWFKEQRDLAEQLQRRINAMKGVITKLSNKINASKQK